MIRLAFVAALAVLVASTQASAGFNWTDDYGFLTSEAEQRLNRNTRSTRVIAPSNRFSAPAAMMVRPTVQFSAASNRVAPVATRSFVPALSPVVRQPRVLNSGSTRVSTGVTIFSRRFR